MLLGKEQSSLEDLLVLLIARHPDLTVEEIRSRMGREILNEKEYSRAAVYKEVKKLTDAAVLFRHEGKYRLHLSWAIDLIMMADTISGNYLQTSPPIECMPEEGTKRRWKLQGFQRLMAFYDNITIYLMRHASLRHCLCWYPRSWFWMVQVPDSKTFFRAVRACRVHSWRILGGTSYIDRAGPEIWDRKLVTWSSAPGPFSDERSRYFHLIDDFLMEFTFDRTSTAHIESFAAKIRSKRDLTPEAVGSFFEFPVRTDFVLEKNAKKAGIIRRKFEDYFGKRLRP